MANGNGFGSETLISEECLGLPMPQELPAPQAPNQRKMRIAYMTSPRELEGEGIGYDNRLEPTLSHLLRKFAAGSDGLSNAEIAAVVVDDDGTERRERVPGSGSGTTPSETFAYLKQAAEQNGALFHVEPSAGWRRIPNKNREEKHRAKMEFERQLLAFMRMNDIDVIYSDSYIVIFNSAMLDGKDGFPGLIINVHPGIVSEVPGVQPNFDALARAKYFTDDPAERARIIAEVENGAAVVAVRRGKYDGSVMRICKKQGISVEQDAEYNYVPVKESRIGYDRTGATVHIVDELIDHGPTVLVSRDTPIYMDDSVHGLRIRNYPNKNETAAKGLGEFLARECTKQLIIENRMKNRAFQGERMHALPAIQKQRTVGARGRRPRKEWREGRRF